MAGKLPLFIAVAVLLPAFFAEATKFIVGDDAGWNLGVNYTLWAEGKQFKVGDRLVFSYDPKLHDVNRVDGHGFSACNTSASTETLTSGNDEIILTAGRKWYICGVGNHCKSGMKLFIDVAAEVAPPSPAPAPENSAGAVASYPCLVAVLLASLAMAAVH